MIETWFPTLIFYEDLFDKFGETFNKQVYEKAKDLQKNHKIETFWNCDTFNTQGINLQNDQLFLNFCEVIKNYVLLFADEYKIDKTKYKLEMSDLWLNVAPPGEYQEYHDHVPEHFSAVYYVQTPENSGKIIFQNFDSWINNSIVSKTENNYANMKTVFYNPRPGLLLIFPSDLLHMVEKNKSTEDRVSIAMNFKFTKRI